MCIQSVAPKAKQSFARNAMLQSISGAYSTACKRFGFDFPVGKFISQSVNLSRHANFNELLFLLTAA